MEAVDSLENLYICMTRHDIISQTVVTLILAYVYWNVFWIHYCGTVIPYSKCTF